MKENYEMAEKLGLPVSARKFDRHVFQKIPYFPSLDENQFEADNKSNDSDNGENQEEAILGRYLFNGEKVYLVVGKLKVFKAKYSETEPSLTVHGKYLIGD